MFSELRLFKDNAKNDAVDGDSQYNYDDNFGTVRNSVNLKTGSEELREYDDKVSSVISFGGTWKLYDTEDRQKGMVVCPGQNYPKVIRNDKYTVIELVSDPNKLCGMCNLYFHQYWLARPWSFMVVCPGQKYPKVIRNDKYTVIELVSDPNKLCGICNLYFHQYWLARPWSFIPF